MGNDDYEWRELPINLPKSCWAWLESLVPDQTAGDSASVVLEWAIEERKKREIVRVATQHNKT